jgi:hypothetical protein
MRIADRPDFGFQNADCGILTKDFLINPFNLQSAIRDPRSEINLQPPAPESQ